MVPSSLSPFAVSIANPLTDPDWDAKLAAFPEATPFHTAAWARVLEGAYHYKPCYFLAGEAGKPTAILPMMEVRSWATARRGVCLPFSDEVEPLGTEAAAGDLFAQVCAHARSARWRHAEFHGGGRLLPASKPSLRYLAHELDLLPDESALWEGVSSSVRRAVRKAEKSGVEIEFSTSIDSMREYYALHCLTRRRHGLPPQSMRFFENVQRHMLAAGSGFVSIARIAGRTAAGAVFLHHGGHAIYKYAASDENAHACRPNNLLIWQSIRRLRSLGFAQLHFGRTSPTNGGLQRFKLSWGTTEREVSYFRYDISRGVYLTSVDRSTGWYAPVFKLLPAPLTRLVGTWFYRHTA